ncbi:cleavage and polyadenylation specificity factor subunit 6 [Pangasianodon hypophthalmus]|uniref:cleavage and polyadenylation specificity factor subunit 6 n=1 Tax=Pangasianodon hypophthalmus TaxID=310915 RepID=UPI00230798D2|nr:cleavage and polyadenylation specificity factor subunit 6 [Pangasianodon hypophthalmus]
MKLQTFIFLAVLLSFCSAVPILRQQLGIIASNSNEIVRLPGLTLSGVGLGQTRVQGTPFLSPFLIQPQPDFLLPPQVVNFGPQVPGQFLPPQQNLPPLLLPPQQNLPPFLLPSLQQEQPTGPINPNNPPPNTQDPAQVVPQYFPFPQAPGGQGFPYYMSYGFPPRNTLLKVPPNQNTANQNAANQNPVGPTIVPQPAQNNGKVLEPWRMTPPPDNRGDRPGRGVEGDPAFPFFQP